MWLNEKAINNEGGMQLVNALTVFNVGSRRKEVARET